MHSWEVRPDDRHLKQPVSSLMVLFADADHTEASLPVFVCVMFAPHIKTVDREIQKLSVISLVKVERHSALAGL